MLDLYKHNETAYASVVSMLENTSKAAVIHPTGTGKSFIGFKLCEDNPDKIICWLSPSEYIFKTQIENIKKSDHTFPLENIRFYTYAKIMIMSNEELLSIKPDYIVFDEFHRCGAEMWGQGVQRLLSYYTEVKMLGLSATNIRYLDGQRDMADELFDNNIASHITLGEAIVRGILAAPKYVTSIYSYQKDLDKIKRRICHAKSKAVRDVATDYFEKLRRALEKADGIDDIFDKHMIERTGKYIVFTSNIEDLQECVSMSSKWFAKVDSNPRIYTVYSDNPTASASFKKFKEDSDTSHLRLLFAIDSLNEGVHVDDISGVILLRPTVSPIIYKQQIGRALAVGKNKTPVIFDIVNNFENLYSIGAIQEEMQAAITYYNYSGEKENIVTERFEIFDEVRECKQLFDSLEDTLTASWDLMYQYALEYYKQYGNLEVPTKYKTADGYSLGHWLYVQRKVRAGESFGILGDERIKKLDAIGMIWESRWDFSWNRYYNAACQYREEYGDLNVNAKYVTKDGIRLGSWICNLRSYMKSGNRSLYLTDEHIRDLDKIDMIWDQPDYLWERNFAAAMKFHKENGHLDVPASCVIDGVKLGVWIRNLRYAYQGKYYAKLTAEQIERLNQIDMRWTDKYTHLWEKGYKLAEQYYNTYGNLNISDGYILPDGYKLGSWITNQRENYKKGKLSPERIARLEAIGMLWKGARSRTWDECFALAKEYYEKNGNLSMPGDYVADGIWICKWLNEQKHIILGKRKGKSLTVKQVELLNSIGFTTKDKNLLAWEEQYNEAKDFYEKNGHLSVPNAYRTSTGKNLSNWIKRQREYYYKNKLSVKQIQLLEALNIEWTMKKYRDKIIDVEIQPSAYQVISAI